MTSRRSAPDAPDPLSQRSVPTTGSVAEADPAASVVVPVYNDPEGIRMTLDSLVHQTLPREWYEVIVVDNGSTDETPSVVEEFEVAYANVRLRTEADAQGSYAARNRGIAAARGEVVAFIDADMSVDPDWLQRALDAFYSRDAAYLGCAVEVYPPTGEETLAGKYNRLTDLRVERLIDRLEFAPTCSLLVDRDLIDEVGRFDDRVRSSGDLEFGNRVAATGRTLHYEPGVTAYHPARTTLRSLLRKSYRIGRGKVELHRYHSERYGHPLRRVANPLIYLPLPPSYVREMVDGWEELNLTERVAFYAIAYLTQLTKAAGQLHEFAAGFGAALVERTPFRGG